MRIDAVHSETSARDALDRLFSQDGGRLPVANIIMHEAAADVAEGLEFWETIVGNIPLRHRVSREFLNRQG